MSKVRKPIWIFGNAVQDITVDVDLIRLARDNNRIRDFIRLEEAPLIKSNVVLKTNKYGEDYFCKAEIENLEEDENKFYLLKPGNKYTLNGNVENDPKFGEKEKCVFLPCENISWGGGGLNVATFLRAISPDPQTVPVKYVDIAKGRPIHKLYGIFEGIVTKKYPEIKEIKLRVCCKTSEEIADNSC